MQMSFHNQDHAVSLLLKLHNLLCYSDHKNEFNYRLYLIVLGDFINKTWLSQPGTLGFWIIEMSRNVKA